MIINLQHYGADQAQAMLLARLMADLEEKPRTDCTLVFTHRFDCELDKETYDYVSKKFPVKSFRTTRRETGWPDGPNQMAGESYGYCVAIGYGNDHHNVVLMMEADCLPLCRNWINRLIEEYQNSRKMINGAWLEHGDAGSRHVNGNMMISLDFGRRCPMIFHPPHTGGWDARLASFIMPQANPSALIWSDYRLGTSDNDWRGCDYLWETKTYGSRNNPRFDQKLHPCFLHGDKSGKGIECVRARLLGT